MNDSQKSIKTNIEIYLRALLSMADKEGLIITIHQQPLQPLAMGYYKSVFAVRKGPSIYKAEQAEAAAASEEAAAIERMNKSRANSDAIKSLNTD